MRLWLFQSGPVPFEIEGKRVAVVGPHGRHNLTVPSAAWEKGGDSSPATGQTTRDRQTHRESLTLKPRPKKGNIGCKNRVRSVLGQVLSPASVLSHLQHQPRFGSEAREEAESNLPQQLVL